MSDTKTPSLRFDTSPNLATYQGRALYLIDLLPTHLREAVVDQYIHTEWIDWSGLLHETKHRVSSGERLILEAAHALYRASTINLDLFMLPTDALERFIEALKAHRGIGS